MRGAATALALQKWAPLFYPDNGQEEYGEVVIHSLGQRLVKAAGRTPPGKPVKGHRFGLNTGNKEKHEVSLTGVLELWSAGVLEEIGNPSLQYSMNPCLPCGYGQSEKQQ
jgi:hypothetical protein